MFFHRSIWVSKRARGALACGCRQHCRLDSPGNLSVCVCVVRVYPFHRSWISSALLLLLSVAIFQCKIFIGAIVVIAVVIVVSGSIFPSLSRISFSIWNFIRDTNAVLLWCTHMLMGSASRFYRTLDARICLISTYTPTTPTHICTI